MRRGICAAAGFAAMMGLSSAASAAVIQFTNTTVDDNGTGFGNILEILVVSPKGNAITQMGSVLRDGADDKLLDDAANQSKTVSVDQMSTAGISAGDFALILNLNEPGSGQELKVGDFDLVFFAGDTESFRAKFDAPDDGLGLTMAGNGQGAAGHLFRVTGFTASELAFFDTVTNRVGLAMLESMTDVAGGAENFYVQPIPEPAAASLLGIATGAVLARRRRRAE